MILLAMEQIKITRADLEFINDLSARIYTGNTLLSKATDDEKQHFIHINISNIISRKV